MARRRDERHAPSRGAARVLVGGARSARMPIGATASERLRREQQGEANARGFDLDKNAWRDCFLFN